MMRSEVWPSGIRPTGGVSGVGEGGVVGVGEGWKGKNVV